MLAADQVRGRRRERGDRIRQCAFAQAERFGPGRDAELLAERAIQPLELPHRGMAITVGQVLAHQLDVRAFIRGVEFDQLTPAAVETEQVAVQLRQVLPTDIRPVLEAILREQFAAVESQGVSRDRQVARLEGAMGERLESERIDRQVRIREQPHQIPAKHHGIRVLAGTTGEVRRLVQLGKRLLDRVIRPDQVQDPLAMQLMRRGEREQLHQGGRLSSIEAARLGYRPVDRDIESAEQGDLNLRHQHLFCGPESGQRHYATPARVGVGTIEHARIIARRPSPDLPSARKWAGRSDS